MDPGLHPPLDWKDIRESAAKFALKYKNVKKEASYKQAYWIDFLKMFGVDALEVGVFEQAVKCSGMTTAKEIDYFWPGKVLIEHKSAGKSLDDAFDQAFGYIDIINQYNDENRDKPRINVPKHIIVSDFKKIRLIVPSEFRDETVLLEDLPKNIDLFGFLAGYVDKRIEGQHPVNVKAAEVMGTLYDLLKKSGYPEEHLDNYLIRLVFTMFAEDAEIFDKNEVTEYLAYHVCDDGSNMGGILNEIFYVLNTPLEKRQKSMQEKLRNFPYVNGGLFAENIPIAYFDRDMKDAYFKAAALDWKYISPAIFGSLFQCIMDPKKRRELGAHYTSEENILKLINPLFMDELREEFENCKGNKKALKTFWDKIANIRIFDPACGCGNFLIISYRELRRLEMDVIAEIYGKQMILDNSHMSVDHYYGIEIGPFAAMVANLSILLMDHIMNIEARNRLGIRRDVIPLKEKANILCANSLRTDWSDLIDPSQLTYIVGNPPFVGHQYRDQAQMEDMSFIFSDSEKAGKLDYVCAWHKKCSMYMKNTNIRAALVSTNSVVQGESASIIASDIFTDGFKIDYAYRTFVWSNEAKGVAAVHCIILGFSYSYKGPKYIFDGTNKKFVKNMVLLQSVWKP